MGVIADRLAAWAQPSVSDDGAWTTIGGPISYMSAAGQVVSQETALRLSAVWACYKVITEAVAQLRLHVYERVSEDERRRARIPLATRLGTAPNAEQTAFEFVEMNQGRALFRQFVPNRVTWRGTSVQAIEPIHPDRVRRRQVAGKPRWEYLEDDGIKWTALRADELFTVPGTPVLDYARDSFGMAQALELYASRSFQQGVRPAGFIAQDPGASFTEEQRKQIKDRIAEEHGGSGKAGGVLWLPEGLKWNQIGMTNQQAEFVATKSFTVADVSRWFRVPPYMLSLLEEGTVSYASVSQQSMDFVVYTLMPWVRRWEQAIGRDLIVDNDRYYAEFLTAEMLRGTTEERFAVYAVALQWGILSVNEVRRLENLNPIEGGDTYMRPLNMGDTAAEAGSPADRLLQSLLGDTVERVVNRERSGLRKADDPDEFYRGHAEFIAQALHVTPAAAESYISARKADPTPDPKALRALALEGIDDRRRDPDPGPLADLKNVVARQQVAA